VCNAIFIYGKISDWSKSWLQCGCMEGKGTTDAIFIVRQLQLKYVVKKKRLRMALVDLEKAFDRVPREVIWWALRFLCVDCV